MINAIFIFNDSNVTIKGSHFENISNLQNSGQYQSENKFFTIIYSSESNLSIT